MVYDVHLTTTITPERNIVYIIVGMVLTLLAGSWTNNSFEPYYDDDGDLEENSPETVAMDDIVDSPAKSSRGPHNDDTDELIAYARAHSP